MPLYSHLQAPTTHPPIILKFDSVQYNYVVMVSEEKNLAFNSIWHESEFRSICFCASLSLYASQDKITVYLIFQCVQPKTVVKDPFINKSVSIV